MGVRGNLDELIDKYLSDSNVAFFSHNNNKLDARDCAYKEAQTILDLGSKNMKLTPERGMLNYKDNPKIIVNRLSKVPIEK